MNAAVIEARDLIFKFFEKEPWKALVWWQAPNPLLGGISPVDMLKIGREEKLLKFIKGQLAENEPPEPRP